MVEQRLRNSFFNTISHTASYDVDSIVNFSDGYSQYGEWFDNDISGVARKSCDHYAAALSKVRAPSF